jgi:hypothetical protein
MSEKGETEGCGCAQADLEHFLRSNKQKTLSFAWLISLQNRQIH